MISEKLKNIKKSIIRELFNTAPSGAINLGLGEIKFKTPKLICDEAKKILDDGLITYTENAGLPELRKKIAEYYKTVPNSICVCNGTQEALFCVLFTLLNNDDCVLISDPSYLAYENIVKMLQANILKFNLNKNFKLDFSDFDNKISQKPKLLLLTHPSNPTGIAFDETEINHIISKCRDNNVRLIVDEVYIELFLNQKIKSFNDYTKDAIIISGLSKSMCMTGWRIGWIMSKNTDLINAFIISHQYISTCTSRISQFSSIAFFSDKGKAEADIIRNTLKEHYHFCMEFFKEHLPFIELIKPDVAPYLFFKLPFPDDTEFAYKLCSKGLITVPGSAFGDNGKSYMRINYAIEKQLLIKGLAILKDSLLKPDPLHS